MDVLIEDVSEATIALLRRRAERHGRTLEEEVRQIIEASANGDFKEDRVGVEEMRAMLGGRRFSDSAELIREDRDR
jgi:plasmid stability protein